MGIEEAARGGSPAHSVERHGFRFTRMLRGGSPVMVQVPQKYKKYASGSGFHSFYSLCFQMSTG